MDHGPWKENEDWTDKFHSVIADRLGIAAGDIRFNLMAVVPDKRLAITHKLNMFKTNRQIVVEVLQQLVKLNHPDLTLNSDKDSKDSPENKHKENDKSIDHLDSVASIEDVLDLATPNKIPRKLKCDKNPSPSDGQDTKCSTSDKEELNSNSTSINDCTNLERNNLLKVPLLVKTVQNDHIKLESSDNAKSSEKVPDYSTPLTIQTSPAPSTSSTDTSSEVGSAFNSPTQAWGWNSGQNSPNNAKDFKKFVVIRVAVAANDDKMDSPTVRPKRDLGVRKVRLEAGALPKGWEKPSGAKVSGMKISPLAKNNSSKPDDGGKTIETPHHTFAPKDLLALLKNLEGEILLCEGNLRDENEKRKKYKIDDCRRTHNYDEFICTFLSMLAQQGKLADLVQQHLMDQKKPGTQPPRPVAAKTSQKKPEQKSNATKKACNRKGNTNKHRKRK